MAKQTGPLPGLERATKLPPFYAAATWLFAGLLIGIFALQGVQDWQRIHDLQVTEACRSARFTVQIISRTINEQRRLVSLFGDFHRAQIEHILDNPNTDEPYEKVRKSIQQFFPSAFAFTLADKHGMPLIDDFDGLLGEVCQNNIRHFAQQGIEQPVFIHPHPEVYHYDLMMKFGEKIFFISFKPDELVNALRENASVGQKIFLLKGSTNLIELGPEGTRQKLQRDIRLSPDEEAAVLMRLPILGSDWRLAILPDVAVVDRQKKHIVWSLAARSIGILLLTSLALWLLRHESRRRNHAEVQALAMEKLSNTDTLSGLPNRRAIDETLAREWQWMERTGQPLTLMMVDVDHFKLYNDTLGHPQGDEAIRSVAEALRSIANRPRDLVGRFGGEEFLLILPDTPATASAFLAEAMHEAIRNKALPHPHSPTSPLLTFSVGVVCATPDLNRKPEQLVELADQALYAAKESGRNKTVIFDPDSTPK